MIEKFRTYISKYVTVTEEQLLEYFSHHERETIRKNQVLAEPGKTCGKLYLIIDGIARQYHIADKKNITDWFYFKGDIMTEPFSFLKQKPAKSYINALTDLDVMSISYEKLQFFYEKDKVWERFGRLITEESLINYCNINRSIKFKTASEKYNYFLEQYPDVVKYIPIGHMASFIGVSIETLSRIRSKK
jgi:CRP-like cAMP-binding protein